MSSKVKERLNRLRLYLEHAERMFLDHSLEKLTGKTCDEAIEILSDNQIRDIVEKIKIKKRKKRMVEIPIEA